MTILHDIEYQAFVTLAISPSNKNSYSKADDLVNIANARLIEVMNRNDAL